MKTLKFKTNVKCNGCIKAITPFLEKSNNIARWNVDLETPDRILSVETDGDAEEIIQLLKDAGYSAEIIN
ncbi:heavy-metal-associated domain-containing protein [Thermophagus xiamenensis]|jgi:copper chaperone|uniref:Copper chaperone CopZ n=1 Tax=Thermophagus xiamenensis TaxID=385682 RepID=A0A1I1ZXX9_9BACT|nr:heavy-metal-associated domain-containing protein [Thermophagus xiamenensis]SFE36479.1 Copper chaperone CopZ [Thermophagus xiamenensis]